jgi:hypothetical protein
MLNWGAFDRILWMGVLCLFTWCVRTTSLDTTRLLHIHMLIISHLHSISLAIDRVLKYKIYLSPCPQTSVTVQSSRPTSEEAYRYDLWETQYAKGQGALDTPKRRRLLHPVCFQQACFKNICLSEELFFTFFETLVAERLQFLNKLRT